MVSVANLQIADKLIGEACVFIINGFVITG